MPRPRPLAWLAPRHRRWALLLPAVAALWPTAAGAYDERIHAFVTRRSLEKAGLDQQAAPFGKDEVAHLRQAIDAHGRAHGDAALRAEWLRRYPRPEDFDAFAMKELLLLNPQAKVFGIDRIDDRVTDDPLDKQVRTVLDHVVRGSREPDDDQRNRERLALDAKRQPIKDRNGNLVPADPALLNIGKLGFLSSQAHAHYGLPQLQFSDDPEVLKTDPRRFAVASGYPKGPILTLAAEMSQLHTDLALLAVLTAPQVLATPQPPGDDMTLRRAQTLAALHTGQAFHYLEDVGNPVHTIQVGPYQFFKDAFFARLGLAAKTCGGYCGTLRSLASIGIDIITNHHTLSEVLAKKRVLQTLAAERVLPAEASALVQAPADDDPAFSKTLDETLARLGPNPERGEFALAITRATIDTSSLVGAEVYQTVRTFAKPRMHHEGVIFDDKGDPDPELLDYESSGAEVQAAYRRFYELEQSAFRRSGTGLRRYIALQQKALAATGAERDALRTALSEKTPSESAGPSARELVERIELLRRGHGAETGLAPEGGCSRPPEHVSVGS